MDDYRRPVGHSMMDQGRRSPAQSSRPVAGGVSPASRTNMYASNHVDAKLDAVDRIQTQVSLNRASLESSVRDIKKATEHIRRLEDGFNQLSRSYTEHFERLQTDLMRQLEVFKQQLAATKGKTTANGEPIDDHTLEVLTRNLSAVSDKANKMDNVELDMQLMKRRLAKLEEQLGSVSLASGRETSVHSSGAHQSPAYAQQPSPRSYGAPPSSMSRQNSDMPHHTLPEPRSHVETHSNRWPTVAQALKRSTAESVVDLSPKRTKLAPLEPRLTASSTNSDDDLHRPRSDPHGRFSDIKAMAASTVHHEPPKDMHHLRQRYDSPPAGSLQHRERFAHHYHNSALPPSMVRPGWSEGAQREMLKDGQLVGQGADGQYYAMVENGFPHGGHTPPGLGLGAMNSKDPYAHTKKTRTKPIRNSDGILIRKDGKPDMRSQSSAANLRKVHARKEEHRTGEGGWHGSPDSHQHDSVSRTQSVEAADSPSNIMLQHSESHSSATGHRRDDSRHSNSESRNADKSHTEASGTHRRSADGSDNTSPRTAHRSPQDSAILAGTISNAPDRRSHMSAQGSPDSPHSYRAHAPPTLPTPVSMQFKQPEVSMLTKQEVA